MSHEYERALGAAMVAEIGERAAQLLFYECEGRPLWVEGAA